jgi:hypothetical protein
MAFQVPFIYGIGTKTILNYFLKLELEVIHKNKELPNDGKK